jgi:hypothetical protein
MIQLLTRMVIHALAGMMIMNLKDQVDAMVPITMMILMLQLNAVFAVVEQRVAVDPVGNMTQVHFNLQHG